MKKFKQIKDGIEFSAEGHVQIQSLIVESEKAIRKHEKRIEKLKELSEFRKFIDIKFAECKTLSRSKR